MTNPIDPARPSGEKAKLAARASSRPAMPAVIIEAVSRRFALPVARKRFLTSPSPGGMAAAVAASAVTMKGSATPPSEKMTASTPPINHATIGRVGSQR